LDAVQDAMQVLSFDVLDALGEVLLQTVHIVERYYRGLNGQIKSGHRRIGSRSSGELSRLVDMVGESNGGKWPGQRKRLD
jgi:hypothetical protein